MKAILRKTALVAGLAAAVMLPSSANAATAALVFTGDAHINCFGCATPSPCNANLNVVGVTHSGTAHTSACTATELSGALCLVSGSANGTVTGDTGTAAGLSLDFSWTRVGAAAVITVSGGSTGAGAAVFVTTGGVACGGSVDATIAGAVAGV